MSDVEDLARAAAAGDRHALDTLLAAVRPGVLARCRRVLANEADAEDACQEALLAVARGVRGFDGRSRFTTWLYPVVAHCAFAVHRRTRGRDVVGWEGVPEPVAARGVSSVAAGRLDVAAALDRLREVQPHVTEAVVLRDLMGLEYAEIAAHLGVPVGTVKSRISHGRSTLRGLLSSPAAAPTPSS